MNGKARRVGREIGRCLHSDAGRACVRLARGSLAATAIYERGRIC